MSYEDKIIKLAKQYEGEDKLGFIKSIELEYKKSIEIERDRFRKDGDEPKENKKSYYQVTVRYSPTERSYNSSRVQTDKVPTLEQCYFQFQEYLKLAMMKREIDEQISQGTVNEDEIDKAPRDLEQELRDAIAIEDYETATKLKKEITLAQQP